VYTGLRRHDGPLPTDAGDAAAWKIVALSI
jgi:hypothetical protein